MVDQVAPPSGWHRIQVQYDDFQAAAWESEKAEKVVFVEEDLPDPTEKWRVVLLPEEYHDNPNDAERLATTDSQENALRAAHAWMRTTDVGR